MTELYITPVHNLGTELCVCGDCGDVAHFSTVKRTIKDAEDRLTPGGEVPAGECRKCGALSYLKKEGGNV